MGGLICTDKMSNDTSRRGPVQSQTGSDTAHLIRHFPHQPHFQLSVFRQPSVQRLSRMQGA